ncbi:MAG: hypothetical protein ACLQLE_00170 [Desulfobaccales bacterium]
MTVPLRPIRSAAALLAGAARYPNSVVLLCTDQSIYLSGGFSLWKVALAGGEKELVATVPVPWMLQQAARCRHLRRLGRLDIRELLQLPGGALLAGVQKSIFRLGNSRRELRLVFRIKDGGRPKGFALTPEGHIFVGEYRRKPKRPPLRIWGSTDAGKSWDLAYQLPVGSAKHIHRLEWDPYRRGLWVLTGDADEESALLFTADEFASVSEVARGSQMFRASQIFCRPEGLYYGTDSERLPNWFVFLDVNRGEVQKIWPLPGSCIYAASMGGRHFLSTAVEPSKVNYSRNTVLWASKDLHTWWKVLEFEKDCWPGEYFGFGRVLLPRVQGECPRLVFSALAVKDFDLTTFILNPVTDACLSSE